MELSKLFEYPMLIYDDKCLSCYKFARLICGLSNGWIRIEGHYYSTKIHIINKIIFPAEYDSRKMFWLVNKKGAWGARSALLPLIVEVIRGRIKSNSNSNSNSIIKGKSIINDTNGCSLNSSSLCSNNLSIFKRILSVLRNSGKFPFNN